MAAHRHAAWIVLAALALAALPASAGDSLPVSVKVSQPTVRLGEIFTVTVQTEPGATCTGQLSYLRGKMAELPTQVADDTGTIVYRLRIRSVGSFPSGTAHVTFWCRAGGGRSGSASADIDVH
jgi:hypothetical protein